MLLCLDCYKVRWKEMAQHSHHLRRDPGSSHAGSGQKWAQGNVRQLSSSLGQKWLWDKPFVNLGSSHPGGQVPCTLYCSGL